MGGERCYERERAVTAIAPVRTGYDKLCDIYAICSPQREAQQPILRNPRNRGFVNCRFREAEAKRLQGGLYCWIVGGKVGIVKVCSSLGRIKVWNRTANNNG